VIELLDHHLLESFYCADGTKLDEHQLL